MHTMSSKIFERTVASFVWVLLAGQTMAADVNWIEVDRKGGRVDVRSEILINAPLPEVYAALLDYDKFAKMGDTFADSRYVEPASDGAPRIYTRTEGCIWFFCKTIERYARLEVQPQQKIVAIAEPELSDAAVSIESWTLTADGDSTVISYRHEIDTGFWVPPLLGALIINRSVEKGTQKAAGRIEQLALSHRGTTVAQNN
jgi:hypothetical protein